MENLYLPHNREKKELKNKNFQNIALHNSLVLAHTLHQKVVAKNKKYLLKQDKKQVK